MHLLYMYNSYVLHLNISCITTLIARKKSEYFVKKISLDDTIPLQNLYCVSFIIYTLDNKN